MKKISMLMMVLMLRVWWSGILSSGEGIALGYVYDKDLAETRVVVRTNDGRVVTVDASIITKSKWEEVTQ